MQEKDFINIKNLSLGFLTNEGTVLEVFKNINISIQKGEFITIIGPSGCGKTCLLKLIGNISLKSKIVYIEGRIQINGMPTQEYKKKKKFGFAFQNPVLLPWRTIKENLLLPLELNEGSDLDQEKEALKILTLMKLSEFANSYSDEISGGMKQKINLGRALIHNPEILLLDEPFGSLDEINRLKLNFELDKIVNIRKQTTILVTHSLREALLLGNKILILSNRPSTIIDVFIPLYKFEKKTGIETSAHFNEELKRLTDIFLLNDISV